MPKRCKVSHPSRLPAKHDGEALHSEVGFMGGPISPNEFYVIKPANDPPLQKLHGFLVQPSARTSASSWHWGPAPTTVEHGSLLGPILRPSADAPPIIRFWAYGPGVRPNSGSVSPGENLLVISQDTFVHIMSASIPAGARPFPELLKAGTSITISILDAEEDGSLKRQQFQAFVIPDIFAHALGDL